MHKFRFLRLCLKMYAVLAVMLALVACGGGGGSGNTSVPTAPRLSLAYESVKTFRFIWADVSGETEYRLFGNPDGISGFSLVATIEADANRHDLSVSLPARINARYILQACNRAGCADSNEVMVDVSNLVRAVGYVKASNPDGEDRFGYSVTLSGDGTFLAVGAYGEDSNATGIGGDEADNSAAISGAVYVFAHDNEGDWRQQAYIKSSNTDADDWFGWSVALSGDGGTLAVGARFEDGAATGIDGDPTDNSATDSGAVYVYRRDSNGIWSQQAYVKASNTDAGDDFGKSVALSGDGNTLVVGAFNEDSNATGIGGDQTDNSAYAAGAVYVFHRNGSGFWAQQAYLKASNTDGLDRFGTALSLSNDGNTLAVGAFGEDSNATGIGGDQVDNSAAQSGAVYVFRRDTSGIWSQQAYIKASNTGAGDLFGLSVALSGDGNILAVGANEESSADTGIDGDQADNSLTRAGAVYVFRRDPGGLWSQQAYMKASNTGADDLFGTSVALSDDGNILVVGALGESSAATGIDGDQGDNSLARPGAVYVFRRGGGGLWSQQAYIKASNTGEGDWFGISVDLSDDGSILAVGAYGEDSGTTGIGGDKADNSAGNSGAVYLY